MERKAAERKAKLAQAESSVVCVNPRIVSGGRSAYYHGRMRPTRP